MPDIARTRSALQALFADNTAGDISAQDLRDFLVSAPALPTLVEVDLGTNWIWDGKFTITDAAITATTIVQVWQAPGPYTGKGTSTDQATVEPINILAVIPGTGSAVVHWETPPIVTETPLLTRGTGATAMRDRQDVARRLNKVRGNVKFYYTIQGS
jgi:hypothetical protein